jgi:hypothetical protein
VKKRDWARGEPPPRGSIEWVGVADMFEPEPPSSSGFQVFELGFTELDAADRWIAQLGNNLLYTRQIHGDEIVTKADETEWEAFLSRWKPFRAKLTSALKSPGWVQMWLKKNKIQFDSLLNESKALHDKFVSKGMPMVPVPYMGELVILLRTMPKQMKASEMRAKLEAGIKCGNKMLDQNTAWWQWRKRSDTKNLTLAISNARAAANLFSQSRSNETYGPGSPLYDEFLRRLTKIYIEAAGLYGIVETRQTAAAEALDEGRQAAHTLPGHFMWWVIAAGAGYAGILWFTRSKPTQITVQVPDAFPTTM